jgi:hypothetical protein
MTATTARPTVTTRPLPRSAHTDRLWRIHEIAPDFRLEDVWALPTPSGPDDLPRLVGLMATNGNDREVGFLYRLLFAIRWKLGAILGLDEHASGIGSRVASLRDRLPDDLKTGPTGPALPGKPFAPVYLTDREWVAEIANSICHALLHIGWVSDGAGGWHGQLAVLSKPNGLMGDAYMAFIKPFRYVVIYPALLRAIARRWESGTRR